MKLTLAADAIENTPAPDPIRAYWDAQPCNIKHSPKPVGSRAYFNDVEARKYFVESHIPRFAEFERWAGRCVLDAGCGIGTDAINFARAGAQVTAVDFSWSAIALVRRRADVYDVPIWPAVCDISTPPMPSDWLEAFDLVYAFGVLHHVPDISVALRNLTTVLKPDGTLKLMVYHRWSWKRLQILLRWVQPEAQANCPIFNTYSRRAIRRLLHVAGFEIERMTVEHIFPWRIADYVQYRYVKAWPWRLVPGWVFRWLEHRIGWHICITARKA